MSELSPPTPPEPSNLGHNWIHGDATTTHAEPSWAHDPTELALLLSDWRVNDLPAPFCVEIGRRLLLAELQFSEWILRRVEKTSFERDRSVSRSINLEFLFPIYAPVFQAHDGQTLRLLPLSMMRRRTLVSLTLRDERDQPLSMPGMRLTQQLDQSILLAAAAAHCGSLDISEPVRTFVQDLIAGSLPKVRQAYALFTGKKCPQSLRDLREDRLFLSLVNRFRHNFSLFVFLIETPNRHRSIQMSFEEPTEWRYQVPRLAAANDGSSEWTYAAGARTRRRSQLALAKLGVRPTRIRFQTPGAEHAASYHFEVDAPPGVQIARATLLAGRPNDRDAPVSLDHVVGHAPTIGLHAVEIPNGSLCRVQLDLRVPTRGWLSTMMVATAAIVGVLISVAIQWGAGDPDWDDSQITNIVVLLVTASAAVATLVAQRDFGGVAARFATGLRALGTVSIALPLIASGVLVYRFSRDNHVESQFDRVALLALTGAALIPFFLTALAWLLSFLSERSSVIEESPWDMTDVRVEDEEQDSQRRTRIEAQTIEEMTFHRALDKYGFDSAAVGIRSAEGWHENYGWDDTAQEQAILALNRYEWGPNPVGAQTCEDLGPGCSSRPGCPARLSRLRR